MIPLVDVEQIIRWHLEDVERRRPAWDDYRASFEQRFWRHHGAWLHQNHVPERAVSGDRDGDPLPAKVEVNLLRPFLARVTAQQAAQRVRMQAMAPAVQDTRPGRPRELGPTAAQDVAAMVDDWANDRMLRAVETQATRMAALYGQAAFKTSVRRPSEDMEAPQLETIDAILVEALPPWEAWWDPYQPHEAGRRYLAHWRQQDLAWIEQNLPENATKGLHPVELVDFLRDGWHATGDETRDKGYFWVLEFHDLTAHKVRWFLGTGTIDSGVGLREVLSEEMPYYRSTIRPLVIESVPEMPGCGLPIVDGLYQKAAERNLMLTVAANAMRVDAARKRMLRKDQLNEEAFARLNDPYDSRWIPVEPDLLLPGVQELRLEEITRGIDPPAMPQSFAVFQAMLQAAQQDEQNAAPLQQGQQGDYLTATESSLLAQYGEQNTNVILSAVVQVRSEVCQDYLMVLAAELRARGKRKVHVLVAGERREVSVELLEYPWRLRPAEQINSPARLAQTRQELLTSMPTLLELLRTATSEQPTAAPDGTPVPPVPEAVRTAAGKLFDWLASALGLPEDLRLQHLQAERDPEAPADPQALVQEAIRNLLPGAGEPGAEFGADPALMAEVMAPRAPGGIDAAGPPPVPGMPA